MELESSETCDVTVVVRVRPFSAAEQRACHESKEWQAIVTRSTTVAIRQGVQIHHSTHNSKNKRACNSVTEDVLSPPREFTFDAVMPESSQTSQVFNRTGAPAVLEVVRGVNAALFAYGQTGSGKTFTLLGQPTSEVLAMGTGSGLFGVLDTSCQNAVSQSSAPGIAAMSFQLLCKLLDERAGKENGESKDLVKYTIEVSALQVYLNQVYDLLSDSDQALLMRAHNIGTTVTQVGCEKCNLQPKATYISCSNVKAFENVMQRAGSGRVQGSTHMNARSSRSHLIITLAVRRSVQSFRENVHRSVDAPREHMSKLILIDLAGNERDSARIGVSHETRLRAEGIDVNRSLSALSACLRQRARDSLKKSSQGAGQVSSAANKPGAGLYRTSTLTRLLKEPLMNAKIFFLACCSPAGTSAAASGQTLTYAAMVKHIKTCAEDSALLLEQGMDRFPIEFLPQHALIQRGQIPRSNENLTVYLHELRVSVVRVMVSHRWLSPNADPNLAHPDTGGPRNPKHALLCFLFERLAASSWIINYDVFSVVDWIDFGECIIHHSQDSRAWQSFLGRSWKR